MNEANYGAEMMEILAPVEHEKHNDVRTEPTLTPVENDCWKQRYRVTNTDCHLCRDSRHSTEHEALTEARKAHSSQHIFTVERIWIYEDKHQD